ncbi:DUF4124 domain-containing protein [Marinobacter changyiensis]|uniref:DUF4124 domain-containing protein n=1 Tax=Marinobacter changyiensis TaxID=2604091 RepID=UPI001264CB43|nr:DUF4124 domain-containing protein [Marinobacter changyiensis]
MNRPTQISACVLFASLFLASTSLQARMYRYVDKSGQMVISNTVPQEASTRGYDILNDQGRVVETVAPAPTAADLAERAASKEREQKAQQQRRADAKLLRRYSHPDDAVRAMHRKLNEMQSLSQLKQGNISVIVNQLDEEQSRAADMERSGRDIPEATLNKIDRLQSQVRDIEREIAIQKSDVETVRKQFMGDIRRLEKITGKERTLSLEPPPPASNSQS